MIEDATRIRQHPRTASRVVDGSAVVIVIDRQNLHTLNDVGTLIWECADGRTLSEVVSAVVDEFDVDPDTALRDTRAFVEQLARIGAIDLE